MFNQKVNGNISDNPGYLNGSMGTPYVRAEQIHNCGSNIQKFMKTKNCNLQSWCSPITAVEQFAMRPIVNSKDYFDNIKKYLADIILADSDKLKQSGMASEDYTLLSDYGQEPLSSFLQSINVDVTNKINVLMANSCSGIKMFSELNPLNEGLVVTDIDITTYQSLTNKNYFYQTVLFSAFNTSRYNTISFKAKLYQDTTGMMSNWNKAIGQVLNSKDTTPGINNVNSAVYVSFIDLLNNTSCVTGQESDCEFKGHALSSAFSNLINELPVSWLQPEALTDNTYNNIGNYDSTGQIKLTDSGPSDFQKLIKDLGF
jgi:hypothetical protein